MNLLFVKNYELFQGESFRGQYEQHDNPDIQLGAIVRKRSDNSIGVVIQTHEQRDGFRTDMNGNEDTEEVAEATLEDIARHRPELLGHLDTRKASGIRNDWDKLEAIAARIDGVWDNKELLVYGALGEEFDDLKRIALS